MPRAKKKVNWNTEKWMLFIQLYRKHECLWNKKIHASKEEIKDALVELKGYFRLSIKDITITDIRTKIKQLNAKYRREKQRVEFLKESEIPVFLKPWFKAADEFLSEDPKLLKENETKMPTYQRTYEWKEGRKRRGEVAASLSSKIKESYDNTKNWEKKVINTYQKPILNRTEFPKSENPVNYATEGVEQNETTESYLQEAKTQSKKVGEEITTRVLHDSLEDQQKDLEFLKLYRQHKCLFNTAYKHLNAVQAAYLDIIDCMKQRGRLDIKTYKDIERTIWRLKYVYLKEKKQVRLLRGKGYTRSEIIAPIWYDFLDEFIESQEISYGALLNCGQKARKLLDTAKKCSDDGWKLFSKFVAEELRKFPHAEALNLQSDIMATVANFKRITGHTHADLNTSHFFNAELDHSGPSNVDLNNTPISKKDENTSIPTVKQEQEATMNLKSDAASLAVNGKEEIRQGCSSFYPSSSGLHVAANTENQDAMPPMIKTERQDMIEIQIFVP